MTWKPLSGNRLRGDASREVNQSRPSVIWGVEEWKALDRSGIRVLLRHNSLAARTELEYIEDQSPRTRASLNLAMLAIMKAVLESGYESMCRPGSFHVQPCQLQ